MKALITTLSIMLIFISCSQKISEHGESNIKQLLKSKNYFELRTYFEKVKGDISEELTLEVQAHLLNVFNKNKASNEAIHNLLTNYSSIISDSLKVELLMLKSDNYLKLFDYNEALVANVDLLSNYQHIMDSATKADVLNMNCIYEPLKDVQPQEVIIHGDNVIPLSRDIANLMNVKVHVKQQTHDFIFDTGAGMSTIKRGFAEELGLEILETTIDVQSATGIAVKSALAVIKQFSFGNIEVKNAVFLVVEDEMLEFPQANYYPLAILGFPVIEELKQFSITKTDSLIVPKETTASNLANMRLEGLVPHVYLFNGLDTLEYAFDTGASKSHYTANYFTKYMQNIKTNSKVDSVTTSSAGGAVTHTTYLIGQSFLHIGTEKATLNNVHVHTGTIKSFDGVFGNLGQDLIAQFNTLTLNFESMYLQFEK